MSKKIIAVYNSQEKWWDDPLFKWILYDDGSFDYFRFVNYNDQEGRQGYYIKNR